MLAIYGSNSKVLLDFIVNLKVHVALACLRPGGIGPQPAQQRILHRSLGLPPQRHLPAHAVLCNFAVKRGRIMASMISRLYHDELHLSERDYPEDSRAAILLDSFKENEKWFKQMLDGKAKERLLELVSIHNELDELVGYESFRDGFILGVQLMMEIACGQGRLSEND